MPPHKRLIKLLGRLTFWWLCKTAGLLGWRSINWIGSALGSAFYACSKRYRTVALKNLRAAYGHEKSEPEIRAMAQEVFRHFARESLVFFYLLSLSNEQINALVDVEGVEHLDNALREGKGCLVITAHYGNWELLARKTAILGHVVNVIARDSDDPGMTGIATRIRESGGYRVFDRDRPMISAFRCLKNNEILGILPDQNESGGVFVDFFGRPAATAIGPALLSLRSGAPIVPAFAFRKPDGRYHATFYPRIEFAPTGDHEQDVRDLTALITEAIEREVRRNPTQWLWLHDRWKLSPEASDVGK